MQIRKQLRANANAFAKDAPMTPEPNGYRGIHKRVRHRSGRKHPGRGSMPSHTKKNKR